MIKSFDDLRNWLTRGGTEIKVKGADRVLVSHYDDRDALAEEIELLIHEAAAPVYVRMYEEGKTDPSNATTATHWVVDSMAPVGDQHVHLPAQTDPQASLIKELTRDNRALRRDLRSALSDRWGDLKQAKTLLFADRVGEVAAWNATQQLHATIGAKDTLIHDMHVEMMSRERDSGLGSIREIIDPLVQLAGGFLETSPAPKQLTTTGDNILMWEHEDLREQFVIWVADLSDDQLRSSWATITSVYVDYRSKLEA